MSCPGWGTPYLAGPETGLWIGPVTELGGTSPERTWDKRRNLAPDTMGYLQRMGCGPTFQR